MYVPISARTSLPLHNCGSVTSGSLAPCLRFLPQHYATSHVLATPLCKSEMQEELKLEPLYKAGSYFPLLLRSSVYLPSNPRYSVSALHIPCSILGMASAGLPSSSGPSAPPRRHTLDNPSGTPFSHRPSNTTVQPIRDAWWSGPNRGLPLRSYTDSLVESEWDDAIRRRHSAGMY